MAFGSKNKKRESWSSRPLSMILSDNVWLFNKKGRSSVDKAIQQSSSDSKYIEAAKQPSARPSAVKQLSRDGPRESSDTVQAAAPSQRKPDVKVSPERTSSAQPSSRGSGKEEPPFLTLSLDASPQQPLDVPEQYLDESTISQEFFSQVGRASEPEEESAEELPESVLAPLLAGGFEKPNEGSLEKPFEKPLDNSLDKSIGSETAKPVDVPAMAPSRREKSVLARRESTDATDALAAMSQGTAFEPASQQSSAASASSTSPVSVAGTISSAAGVSAKGDSFLLGSNRKVVVGRGVYIFDPAEPGAARELQLSAAESFNPFDLE